MKVFDVPRSTYTSHQQHKNKVNADRERLKAKVVSIHENSRGAAGSRTIAGQLNQQGETVGRYKVRTLMKEAKIESKQPGRHRYKAAIMPSDIAANHLAREFNVKRANQAWCGDVTYSVPGVQH